MKNWRALKFGNCKECDVSNYCDRKAELSDLFDCGKLIEELSGINDLEIYCLKNIGLEKLKEKRF